MATAWLSRFETAFTAAATSGARPTFEFLLEELPTPEELRAARRLALLDRHCCLV